jgi:uncharacterized protein YidB (DUF937 family)
VLGSAQVQAIAAKLGLSAGDAAGALAQFLPQAVDTMTPGGQIPDGQLMEQGLSLLKGLTGKG